MLLSLVLVGCLPENTVPPSPVPTPTQLVAPSPTALAAASSTPEPALLSTPEPTPTELPPTEEPPSPTAEPTVEADPVLVGAGDIVECGSRRPEQTAALLDEIPGTVFTLGDNAYDNGTAAEYQDCYDPTWGRHKARTRPVPGNHDYNTDSGAPYYAYFGENAGPANLGYYSYDLGTWHILALNSNLEIGAGSVQAEWVRADLEAHPVECTLAYWHEPLFTSGEHRNEPRLYDLWRLLYEYHVDVVMNGNDHDYERFAPQDPDANPDPDRGMRAFVVGTGGGWLREFTKIRPNSEVRDSTTWGVLKLTLHPGSYDWDFIPISMEGQTFRDEGHDICR
jgi:hypothetical protein